MTNPGREPPPPPPLPTAPLVGGPTLPMATASQPSSTLVLPSPLSFSDTITDITPFIPIVLDLNSHNYYHWHHLFEIHLGRCSLLHHISGDVPPAPSDPRWVKDDLAIIQWLYTRISTELFNLVVTDGATARDIWAELRRLFQDNRDARVSALNTELRTITQGDRPVGVFCQRIKAIGDELRELAVCTAGDPHPSPPPAAHARRGPLHASDGGVEPGAQGQRPASLSRHHAPCCIGSCPDSSRASRVVPNTAAPWVAPKPKLQGQEPRLPSSSAALVRGILVLLCAATCIIIGACAGPARVFTTVAPFARSLDRARPGLVDAVVCALSLWRPSCVRRRLDATWHAPSARCPGAPWVAASAASLPGVCASLSGFAPANGSISVPLRGPLCLTLGSGAARACCCITMGSGAGGGSYRCLILYTDRADLGLGCLPRGHEFAYHPRHRIFAARR
ncbi:uncharacterized protein LOC125519635 [Triticum urartu]|uniref:uncharacterized protein LOC125519635 n=1 Tax=Triticum urartu TaxID=4572 RepID=UPI0020447B20|nr:uncharacterized protein LOC125519635 [Triticum urartu]